MNNVDNLNNITFVSENIGGENDDTLENFNNQINIVSNESNDYDKLIDYYNKQKREKNKNDDYVERLDNELHANIYRVNNFPTYVDDVNFSNPLIYPKNYDQYFSYLNKKNINPINTQVVKKKEYLNIDSANRILKSSLNINKYYAVKDHGLEFKTNSNLFKIYLETPISQTKFDINDNIILRGFKSYTIYYDNIDFYFTNGSPVVSINIKPNFLTSISYTNITIVIEGLGTFDTNKYWKNIPYQLLNGLQKIFITDTDKISFSLPINFYSYNQNNDVLNSSCKITFNCLGNYPINLINANTPLTSLNLTNYLTIKSIGDDYIEVLLDNTLSLNDNIPLDGYWNNESFFTGKNIQIGKIDGFTEAFNSSNNFSIFLNKTYNNIAEIKIISSEIPNIQKNIISDIDNTNTDINTNNNNMQSMTYINNDVNLTYIEQSNNKLYWENILDEGIYYIELEPGNYSYELLKKSIETGVSKILRKPIFENEYLCKYNDMEVEFNNETSITTFRMYDTYNVPNCFVEFSNMITEIKNEFKIKIYLPYHNLKMGDIVFISNSLDYYTIDKKYINTLSGHYVTNVYDKEYFEITLTNINTINSVGDTKGGYDIQIKKYAIFRLYFNFNDTFGELIGFKLVGYDDSITDYSNAYINNLITNKEPYYNDISSILIVNNTIPPQNFVTDYQTQSYNYILLLIDGLNNNNNPNGPAYFYKFLINKPPGEYLFNTFVNSPVYFNPPIRDLNELKLTLVYPNGGLVNMGTLDYSLTFEITTLNNCPENTKINTNMSRI